MQINYFRPQSTKLIISNSKIGIWNAEFEKNQDANDLFDFLNGENFITNIANTNIGKRLGLKETILNKDSSEEHNLDELKRLIDSEKKGGLFYNSKSQQIADLIEQNFPTKEDKIRLLNIYEYQFSSPLMGDLKSCSSNLSTIKLIVSPFINSGIAESEYPHKLFEIY